MIKKHLETTENNNKIIYLYLDNSYEISDDLYLKKDTDYLLNSVKNYLDNNDLNYKKKDIYLVIDNIIVGKVNTKMLSKNMKLHEMIRFGRVGYEDYLEEHPYLKLIDFEKSDGIVKDMKLDNYLANVIMNEMPNVDEIEALKAQCVISRTYVIKRIMDNKKIKEINNLQIYRNKEELKYIYGNDYYKYINLVKQSIKETDNEIIKYKNDLIKCYTHYKNTGKTEDSMNVLNENVPYLKSVNSYDKDDLIRYRKISNRHLSKLLGVDISPSTRIRFLNKTSGNNYKYVLFNKKCFDAMKLANRLGLSSYNYDIRITNDYTFFAIHGCGINLGLSKFGAIEMAKQGYNYQDIIKHYFKNTYIEKI